MNQPTTLEPATWSVGSGVVGRCMGSLVALLGWVVPGLVGWLVVCGVVGRLVCRVLQPPLGCCRVLSPVAVEGGGC